MGSDEKTPREYVSELLQRIATLERERDEARTIAEQKANAYKQLYGCYAAACGAFVEYGARNDELEALCRDGKEALAWALDLLDMYDGKLIDLGEPRGKVYTQIHLSGKVKARDVEKRMRKAGGE